MDVKNQVLVVGTAGRHIQIFDLSNPLTPFKVGHLLVLPFFVCLAYWGILFVLVSVDGSFAVEVADQNDYYVSER